MKFLKITLFMLVNIGLLWIHYEAMFSPLPSLVFFTMIGHLFALQNFRYDLLK